MRRNSYFIVFISFLLAMPVFAKNYTVSSPNKKIVVRVEAADKIRYSVRLGKQIILLPSEIALTVDGTVLGENDRISKAERHSVSETIRPVVRQKSASIENRYNELTLTFRGYFTLIFRVYDDGVAYRFVTGLPGRVKVMDEKVQYRFDGNWETYFPETKSFFTHQESEYKHLRLVLIRPDMMSYVPVLVELENGVCAAVTEADLEDYAGLYLQGTGDFGFDGVFPRYPLEEKQLRDRDVPVTKRADYIAETDGSRSYPWRVLIIADDPGRLVESQMVFTLAPELALTDTDWIKPGKVSWDWWNANNLYGVDFEAGINTRTYKYYIDFASSHGADYIILDEGWYELGNLLAVKPEINIPELVQYGNERGVGIILWVVWKTLDDQLDEALNQFSAWGIKGIKVDFMQREDQEMINFYHKIARKAAEHKLLVDFHGSCKPDGLRRAYPNVMTREGVRGMEHCKWSDNTNPEHDLILPFTRMVAGPMDYTPGAMINATKENFNPSFTRPMSLGTRCHQLAMYVVYESPLQMLADSPSNYLRERMCMEFLSQVPVIWDETKVLQAAVSDYILMARRSGDTWYVGAMTDWTPRELSCDLSFLGEGKFQARIWQDGVNASRRARDFATRELLANASDSLSVLLAPGGGWVAILEKIGD